MKGNLALIEEVLTFLFRKPLQYLYLILAAWASYLYLGPFFSSGIYRWIKVEMASNPILAELIDLEGMLADKYLVLLAPVCVLWSVSFYVYHKKILSAGNINRLSKLLSVFVSGAGFFISLLGAVLIGICLYFLRFDNSGFPIGFLVYGVFIILSGFFFNKLIIPDFDDTKDKNVLRVLAYPLSITFGFSAFLLYAYSVISDPINLYLTVVEAYENANQ